MFSRDGHVREQRVVLEHHADRSRWYGGSCDSGLPSSRISPAVGVSKPASIISVVVLPDPDGPSSVRNSPALDVEIEIVDDPRDAVVRLADADEANDRLRHADRR